MKSLIARLCCVAALYLLPSADCAACPQVAVATVHSAGAQAVAVCPSVAVQSLAVQSFAVVQPQVQVQSFAVPVQQLAAQPVSVQTFAVQALAVPVQAVAVRGQGGCAQRSGILSRLGTRRLLPKAKSVSVVR